MNTISDFLPGLCIVLFKLETVDKMLFLRVGDVNVLLTPFLKEKVKKKAEQLA